MSSEELDVMALAQGMGKNIPHHRERNKVFSRKHRREICVFGAMNCYSTLPAARRGGSGHELYPSPGAGSR